MGLERSRVLAGLAAVALSGNACMPMTVPVAVSPAKPTAAFPTPWDAAPPAGSPAAGLDAVVLQDGSRIEGHVQKSEPGQFVVIQTTDGATRTLSWSAVKEVVQGGGAPSPTTGCVERDPSGTCTDRTAPFAGPSGAGFGFSSERVERIRTPPSAVANFAFDAMFTYGTMKPSAQIDSLSVVMAGASLGLKALVGGKLPGSEGGSWSGVGIEPSLGAQVGTLNMTSGSFSGTGTVLAFSGGGNVGYQFLTFGKMDDETLRQSGFGLFLGYHAGVQKTKTEITMTLPPPIYTYTESDSTTDFSHGPVVGLSFPAYNAGTTKLTRIYFNAMLLPTGDFTFATLAGGATF